MSLSLFHTCMFYCAICVQPTEFPMAPEVATVEESDSGVSGHVAAASKALEELCVSFPFGWLFVWVPFRSRHVPPPLSPSLPISL